MGVLKSYQRAIAAAKSANHRRLAFLFGQFIFLVPGNLLLIGDTLKQLLPCPLRFEH